MTINGHRQIEKQTRNELAILFLKVLQLNSHAAKTFNQYEIQDSCTLFLTHTELKVKDPILESFILVTIVNLRLTDMMIMNLKDY